MIYILKWLMIKWRDAICRSVVPKRGTTGGRQKQPPWLPQPSEKTPPIMDRQQDSGVHVQESSGSPSGGWVLQQSHQGQCGWWRSVQIPRILLVEKGETWMKVLLNWLERNSFKMGSFSRDKVPQTSFRFCEPVWPSGMALGWEAEGPRFDTASALLSLQKGCGLWILSCDFVHHFLLKH